MKKLINKIGIFALKTICGGLTIIVIIFFTALFKIIILGQ